MRFSYQTEQWLEHPVERVFKFFCNPKNLPSLMPSWQKARIDAATIVPPPLPPESDSGNSLQHAGSGSRLTLSFKPLPYLPVRLRWHAEISEFAWNQCFCDRQLSGPFSYWNHCHYVRPAARQGHEGTLVIDDLEYELPFGIAGEIAHRLILRKQIERTFAYRQKQVSEIFAQSGMQCLP